MSHLRRPPGRLRRHHRGASLVIALIALLALTFAGLAMIRAVDTASLIAGNFAYRQAATSVADLGFEAALGDLDIISASTVSSWDTDQVPGGNLKCNYYAFNPGETGDNANGVSTRVQNAGGTWSANGASSNTISFGPISGYAYQCAIERLCQDPHTVDSSKPSAIQDNLTALNSCYSLGVTNQYSLSANSPSYQFRSANQYGYRVTVRIQGPRNTTALVQSIVLKSHTF